MTKTKKKMNLILKFHLALVVPLIVVAALVAIVTKQGLENNAEKFTELLKIQAKANRLLPLLLTQDDASKSMLLDPDRMIDFSEKKVEAYDQHKALLDDILSIAPSMEFTSIITELSELDDQILRGLDSKLLETLFDDHDKARAIYFNEYLPQQKIYLAKIKALKELSHEKAEVARLVMNSENENSVLQVLIALLLGILVVSAVIIVLSRQIQRSEDNTKRLLASLSEGLFFFDRQGKIAPERSQALYKMLPDSSKHETTVDFFEYYLKSKPEDVNFVLNCLWEEGDFLSPFEATANILGKRFSLVEGDELRHFQLGYHAINELNGKLDKVVVNVTDVTKATQAAAQQKIQAERIKRIAMVASNTDSFIEFFEEAIEIIRSIDLKMYAKSDTELKVLKRLIHTLKGNTATFEFEGLATDLHCLEDILEGKPDREGLQRAAKAWEGVKDRWKFETTDIQEVFKLDKAKDKISISRSKYKKLKAVVAEISNESLQMQVNGLEKHPLEQVFSKYKKMLDSQSIRQGKSLDIDFEGESVDLSYEEIKPIDAALVHIFRNCLDHGIENVDKRLEKGKSAKATISVGCYEKNGLLHLIIKDDGKGIDTELLTKKAVKIGVWSEEKAAAASDQEKIELIFQDNLSSKAEVTELSGRGIGMAAVKADLGKIGGTISVFSAIGSGTQFEVDFPS